MIPDPVKAFSAGSPERGSLLDTFLEMVRIDSPSGGEAAFRDYLSTRFRERGVTDIMVDPVGNLIVDLPPIGSSHGRRLVVSGHMDVVPPCLGIKPVVEESVNDGVPDRIIRSDNTTVLGADDKSGLAPILEAVFYAMDHQLPHPALRLIFTVEEETGLAGARGLDSQFLLDADFAVTLDHTGQQGVIINEAPTYIQFELQCHGVSSHAGMQPEKGVNAISLAGRILSRLNLGRLDADTTMNVGSIQGGKADNVVPDRVVMSGELRSHNPERILQEIMFIEQVLKEEADKFPGSRTTSSFRTSFLGYSLSPEHPGVARVAEAALKTELTPVYCRTNGGSDNNVFVERGLPGVVLSAGYVDPHALTEQVSLNEMTVCARFLLNIFQQFAQ